MTKSERQRLTKQVQWNMPGNTYEQLEAVGLIEGHAPNAMARHIVTIYLSEQIKLMRRDKRCDNLASLGQ